MSEAQIAHRRLVQSLYKRSLKTAQDWYVDTNLFRRKAVELRMQFEANRNVNNPRQLASIVQDTERQLTELRHPDPYIGMPSRNMELLHTKITTDWDKRQICFQERYPGYNVQGSLRVNARTGEGVLSTSHPSMGFSVDGWTPTAVGGSKFERNAHPDTAEPADHH
ncbi:hypothetical protein BGX26_004021 [Mortierella sp. AD094]|nr:hypothetical protein BGX26_004021 [Mortierella sp. AD094]